MDDNTILLSDLRKIYSDRKDESKKYILLHSADEKTNISFAVRKYLTSEAYFEFINGLAGFDFSDQDDKYRPFNSEYLFVIRVMEFYTNLPAWNFEADTDDQEKKIAMDELYDMVTELGIYEAVMEYIAETEQFKNLRKSFEMIRNYELLKHTGMEGLLLTLTDTVSRLASGTASEMTELTPGQMQGFDMLKAVSDLLHTTGEAGKV